MPVTRVVIAVAVGVTATLVGGPVAAAPAATVGCGAVVTADTTLKSDLVCSGGALTLSGDVVLDLGGHRITSASGIAIAVLGDGSPTITHGRITDSGTGVAAPQEESDDPLPPRQVTISRVAFTGNTVAVQASGTSPFFAPGRLSNFTVHKSDFRGNDDAITGVSTGRFDISSSSFTNNGRAVAIDTGAVTVTHSYFGGNLEAFRCVEANPCALDASRLVGNDSAVSVNTGPLTLTRSLISGSQSAVSVFVGFGVVIARNRIDDSTTGVDLVLASAQLTDNLFTRNQTGFTASDLGGGFEATLAGNRFLGNGDGIFTEATDLRLADNLALHNTGWGIFAPNATDLGGNRASGNGQSPQCVGVAC